MEFTSAIRAVAAVLRRPGDLLPFYLVGAAVPAIARLPLLVGLAGAYLHLRTTGRLAAVREGLAGADLEPPSPDDPAAVEAWVDAVAPLLEPLVTPASVGLVVAGALGALTAGLALNAVAAAGQIGDCYGRLRDRRGLVDGIAAARAYWLRFLGLRLLELLAAGVAVAAAAGAFGVAFLGGPVLGAVVGLVAVLALAVVLILLRALFAFAPVAVVVDDRGVGGALAGAVGFVRARPADALGYYAVAVAAAFGVGSVAGSLALVDASTLAAVLGVVVVAPALDLLKTALYADRAGTVAPPPPPAASPSAQLRAGLAAGWRELWAFARGAPGLVAASVAVALAGAAAGWVAVGPLVGGVETSIRGRTAGVIPPAAAVEFATNNWTVAVTTAFSGLALALPAVAAVWINGFAFAAVARLEVEPLVLAAFVAPHGVLEIPAILLAGALGFRLGIAWWRTVRGRADRAALADALERAFRIAVGLGILLAAAALVEGFVSPYYWRLFL